MVPGFQLMAGFIKRLMFMELLVRGEGMSTFGERVKKAWKNINEIKPKNNDMNQKKDEK
jgi:hypothetical protein